MKLYYPSIFVTTLFGEKCPFNGLYVHLMSIKVAYSIRSSAYSNSLLSLEK